MSDIGYLRPHRVLHWWQPRVLRRMLRNRPETLPKRPWLRYALIVASAESSSPVYKIIGHRWTRWGARRAVWALRAGRSA